MEKIGSVIKRVFIKRLWDYKDIDCQLFDDVNILIGSNGTSKTTFLTIVEALLNVDLTSIEDIEFEAVRIDVEVSGQLHVLI